MPQSISWASMARLSSGSLLILLLTALAAAAQEAHPACATRDFGLFFEKYMALSLEDQASCVQYPINVPTSPTPLGNRAEYAAHVTRFNPRAKIIGSPDSLIAGAKASSPYFAFDPARIEKSKIGYVLKAAGDEGQALLTDGGYNVFDISDFKWNGANWLLRAVYEPEEESD